MKQQVINAVDGIYPATPDYVHAIELSAMQRLPDHMPKWLSLRPLRT